MKHTRWMALALALSMLVSLAGITYASELPTQADVVEEPTASNNGEATDSSQAGQTEEGEVAYDDYSAANYTTDDAIVVYANGEDTTVSGSGSTNTVVEAQEQTMDDFLNEQLDGMMAEIEDSSGESTYPDPEDTPPTQEDILQAESYLSTVQTQENSGSDLTSYYTSQIPNYGTTVMDAGGGVIVEATDFMVSDNQMLTLVGFYTQMQTNRFQFNLQHADTQFYMGANGRIYDTYNGSLAESAYMSAYIEEMLSWLHGEHNSNVSALTNYWDRQTLESLIDYTNGGVQAEQLDGSEIYFGVPISNTVLTESLNSYVQALHDIGVNNVKVTKFTVYNAESYSVRTVKSSSPSYPLQYHWTVSNLSGSKQVDEWTETQPYIRILFESAGDYYIKVAQNRNVIRNNKVSGYKTEIWMLNNGDIFDGLVFYSNTSTFQAFLSADIGPTVEELQLTQDSFIANVTEKMVGKTQMLDESGYLHQAADDFTTERH